MPQFVVSWQDNRNKRVFRHDVEASTETEASTKSRIALYETHGTEMLRRFTFLSLDKINTETGEIL